MKGVVNSVDRTWRIRNLRRCETELVEAMLAVQDAQRLVAVKMQALRRNLKWHGNQMENGHEPATYIDAGLTQCAEIIAKEGESVWQ